MLDDRFGTRLADRDGFKDRIGGVVETRSCVFGDTGGDRMDDRNGA